MKANRKTAPQARYENNHKTAPWACNAINRKTAPQARYVNDEK